MVLFIWSPRTDKAKIYSHRKQIRDCLEQGPGGLTAKGVNFCKRQNLGEQKCLYLYWSVFTVAQQSLEGLMLKLKLQYFGHLMQRTDLLEKTLMLPKTEGRREGDNRGWDDWMASLIWWTWVWVSSGSWWWTGKPGMLQSMRSQRVRYDCDWTELEDIKVGKL